MGNIEDEVVHFSPEGKVWLCSNEVEWVGTGTLRQERVTCHRCASMLANWGATTPLSLVLKRLGRG
jgi:hypothetical protein